MNNKGFSLIELLIVIVIIGIIAIIAVPSLLESKKASQHTAAIAMLRNLASAQVAYSSKIGNNGAYGTLPNLVTQGFLDPRFSTVPASIDGFAFNGAVATGVFTISANGQGPNAGSTYYINHSMVVCTDAACTSPVNSN